MTAAPSLRLLPSLLLPLLLAACTSPLPPDAFAATTPAFDPVTFWSAPTTSWGVIENRDAEPTAIVTTTTDPTPDGDNALQMTQRLHTAGKDTVRHWHIRRLDNHQFEATANDVVGAARGTAAGRTFHWKWTLATKPGDPLRNVTMDQHMYLADNGALMVRTTISKLGLRLAQISEQFTRRDPNP
jgi:hypothetical protein